MKFGIIGGGGTTIVLLERFIALGPHCPDRNVEVVVWEPNEPGPGLHARHQPEALPLNTIASQVGVYPREGDHWENPTQGPTLFEWLSDQPGAAHFQPWDFVPRRLCGAYLAEAFSSICERAPVNVSIRIIREQVEYVTRAIDSRRFHVKDKQGGVWVDQLCFCQGHTGRKRVGAARTGTKVIDTCYPLPGPLADVAPGSTVGVEGMGLVASDVITMFTLGRGGKYDRRGGRLTYTASGREPEIWLYSRSGMPFHARPFIPLSRKRHEPLVLTREKIDLLRQGNQGPRLSFGEQILPLLKVEMAVAFHCTRQEMESAGSGSVLREHLSRCTCPKDPGETELCAALELLDGTVQRFDREAPFASKPPEAANGDEYRTWLIEFLCEDAEAADAGLLQSPFKAALEVCRDLRDILRYAVDFEGLNTSSHREFYRVYAPIFNRLVGGPTSTRNRELVALLKANVVGVAQRAINEAGSTGPLALHNSADSLGKRRTIELDWIVRAHGETSGIIATASGPLAALHKAGLATSVYSAPGLDGVRVDRVSRPIDRNGQPVDSLSFLGPLTEGSRFYNHYLASADGPCRLRDDAEVVARRALGLPLPSEITQQIFERIAS